jgi:prepilin-type N-terminal cleavage/methylation domain-containing protein
MEFKPTNLKRRQSGFTLVELMVGTTLGSLLLIGVASLYLFSAKSFVAMTNYVDLNSRNRRASDWLSRDIRSATSVSSATSSATNSQLALISRQGDVTYVFDGTAGTLTRWQLGRAKVLLEGITSLNFSLYQRPATGAGYETFPAATAATAKLIGFDWMCSRKVYGSLKNTETIQKELVELRNQ